MWTHFTILLIVLGGLSATVTRFTNVNCEMLDTSFAIIKECRLKVLGRNIVGLNAYATMLQLPVTNIKINLSLWRKFNGYRPFMFNATFDFCKFLTNPSLSFQRIMYDAVIKNSNINHSCPYAHDLIVRDFVLREEFFKFMPLPSGEYKIQAMVATKNKWRANIIVHMLRTEDLINT